MEASSTKQPFVGRIQYVLQYQVIYRWRLHFDFGVAEARNGGERTMLKINMYMEQERYP